MAKDITLKTRNGETRYPKSVTDLIFENGTGKTLQTIITELREADTDTNTRTRMFKADVTNLDTLNKKTDIGLYNYVGNGWRGAVSINYDSADNVSQVALSSSTPSYSGNTLTWLSAQPCAMARTYTNGAWTHWEKVGAPVVNDLTTGGTDKALSAEMGKTLKEGLDALGPKLDKVEAEYADSTDEQQIWSNDAGTDEYAKIDANGVWGKNLKYQDGASVKDVKTELAGKMPNKTIDSTPTAGSNNLVSSGGVKEAIDNAAKYKDITEDVADSSVDKIEITDDNGKTYSTVEIDESTANEDEQTWGNDAGTDIYAKVNSQGVYAKKFFTLDGIEIGGGQVIPNLIVVDAAGNGDYTSLVDALNNAGDTQTKHVTILVMAGTYEMPPKVSYNAPYVESNRNLTIKGVNRNKCILTSDIGFYDYTIGTDCATLRLTGNVTIENLTIISSNEQYNSKVGTEGYVSTRTGRKAAYSIHLDQGRRVGDVVLVKDCTIINKQMSCIGFGLREDSTIRIENCDLVCEQAAADSEANDYGTIWGHNASGQDVGGQRLEIINNRITHKTGQYALRLSFAGQEGTYENLEVSYLLVGNAVNTTNPAQSLIVNGFPEGTCTHDAMSFGNQAETMNINN